MIKSKASSKSLKNKTLATKTWLKRFELPVFSKGDKIILAISGGPDSTFLLEELLKLPNSPKIILCHINYHLRGWASNSDQQFVENLAQKYALKLEIFSSQANKLPGNLEENCRNIRYWFFEEMRLKHEAKWIFTAHNLDDQVETFLMNLTRGASLNGFNGISAIDTTRHLIRPILNFTKTEILTHLKTHKIAFRQDRSNFNLQFRRNFVRLKIIPLFQKINPNFLITVGKSIKNLQENHQIIQTQIDLWLKENFKKTPKNRHQFDLNKFLESSESIQRLILSSAHQLLHQKSLTRQQIQEILLTLQKKRAGLRKEFGPNTELKIIKHPKTQKRLVVISPILH